MNAVEPGVDRGSKYLGLCRPLNEKSIPIHLLYENGGSALYEEIEAHPDYYPYSAERRLLLEHARAIVQRIEPGSVLVELGCGDCTKSNILIHELARRDARVDFVGIDASIESLERNQVAFAGRQDVQFTPIHETFFEGLARVIEGLRGRHLCVMLLGSTLGNMAFHDSEVFLANMIEMLSPLGRRVPFQIILGLDLWKDADTLERAYDNDVTRLFGLNGLRNALIGADPGHCFNESDWRYRVKINVEANQVEMYAVALRPQSVVDVVIEVGEEILLEISHKFTGIELEALFCDHDVVGSFGDEYRVFVISCVTPDAINPWMAYSREHIADIDRVAGVDYEAFIRTFDWSSLTPPGHGSGHRPQSLTLLDVGCGSGFVPKRLPMVNDASRRFAGLVGTYDLVDISANSLRIASEGIPFHVGRKYHSSIQDFGGRSSDPDARAVGRDVVWSIHGITAVRREDLWLSLLNMLECVKFGGKMVIVMSDHQSHYAAIDRAYLHDRGDDPRLRGAFLVAEDVMEILGEHGIAHDVVEIASEYVFPAEDATSWRNFNAWCVYDPSFDATQGGPATSAYVESMRSPDRADYRLRLTSRAIVVERDWLTILRWRAREPGIEVPGLHEETYSLSCEAFEAQSSQRRAIIRHIAGARLFDDQVGDSLRVFSIGCGDGQIDAMILGACLPLDFRGSLHYTGVDESAFALAECRRCFTDRSHFATAAEFTSRAVRAAAFEAADPEQRFDCGFMLHVLYYVDDFRETIRRGLERLAPGGRLVIWQAPNEAMNLLSSVLWSRQHQHPIPFADDIECFLRAEGLRFTVERIDGELELDLDADGSDLVLSFLFQVDHSQLSRSLISSIRECVADFCSPQGTIPHPVVCFIVARE